MRLTGVASRIIEQRQAGRITVLLHSTCDPRFDAGRMSLPIRLLLLTVLLLSTRVGVASDCVVLLHGLARSAGSMEKMAQALEAVGFASVNIDYPSRKATISVLADEAVPRGLAECKARNTSQVHFVTHSMGGILVRQYLSGSDIDNLGRVVMLAPPNKGSEVVDQLSNMPGYDFLNGPAGQQLGSGSNSVPNRLGPVDFDLGVIAGTETFNPILSQFLPNPDDGKVSVESTKVEGMCGFVAMPATHTFIMRSDEVIAEVISYLQTGRFQSDTAMHSACGKN